MSNQTIRRTRNGDRRRFILGVFMVAWLNLAVQPCVVAMESNPAAEAISAQSVHANHAIEHDCDHCPPVLSAHANACVSAVASDCGSIADFNNDGRNSSSKLKDIPTYLAIAHVAIPTDFIIPISPPPPVDCAALDHPNEPALNIRFCVFLK